jgi:hypothetical protein
MNVGRSKKGFWKEPPREAPFSEAKIPLFQKTLIYEGSQKNLENIASFIEEKLYAMKAYAGTHLAHQAKEELDGYMQALRKDRGLFQTLKDHNQQLIKEAQHLLQEQVREQGMNRGIGLDI